MPSEKNSMYLIGFLALALGIMTDYLLIQKTSGISFFIFNIAIVLSMFVLLHRSKIKPGMNQIFIASFILLFSFAIISRSSPFLTVLDVAGILYLIVLLLSISIDNNLKDFKLISYFTLPLFFSLGSFLAAEKFGTKSMALSGKENKFGSGHFWAILRGVAISIPFLVILGWLLYSSDTMIQAYFEKFKVIDINIESFFHWIVVFIATSYFIGMFSRIASGEKKESSHAPEKENKALGFIESLTVLSLVETLFFFFIIFQFYYLFGGKDYVWGSSEMITYSGYAKKGFFELMAASIISFLMIYSLDYSGKRESEKQAKIFKASEAVIIAEIIIIIFSAFKRFALYVDGYGLTFSRFVAIVILVWILCAFFTLLAKIFLEKKSPFIYYSMFWATGGLWLFVNVINPDALITKINVERLSSGREVDYYYLSSLSQDAIPEIVKIFDSSARDEVKQEVAQNLYDRYDSYSYYGCMADYYTPRECKYVPIEKLIDGGNKDNNWRSFNYSKIRSEIALKKYSEQIEKYLKQYWKERQKDCKEIANDCEKACDSGSINKLLVPRCKENCGGILCNRNSEIAK